MKKKIQYSYKRDTDRNIRAKSSASLFQQAIFGSILLNEIYDDSIVANIDESHFGRSVKSNYSWLPINECSGIINVGSQGTITLIWSLLSNGHWIWLLNKSTTTAQDFCLFLYIHRIYLDTCLGMPQSQIVVTLDNASIHWTSETMKTASSLGMKIVGLPPYCPHLAPAEFVFCMVKGYLRSRLSNKIVDYSKGSGKRAIIEGLEWMNIEKGIRMWSKIIKEAKIAILEAYKIIMWSRITPKENNQSIRISTPIKDEDEESKSERSLSPSMHSEHSYLL